MSQLDRADGWGISLRQAALVAGVGLLIMLVAAPFAEFYVFPTLITEGNIQATVRNIRANGGLYLAGVFAYILTYACDVFVAWGLYVLLTPVNRPVSLLAAWFRLIYTVIAVISALKLVTVFRILTSDTYAAVLDTEQVHAQVQLMLSAYRYEWGIGLMLFGIHLALVGYLVYRSGYIPQAIGALVAVAGLGYLVSTLGIYVAPDVDFGWVGVTFLAEPVFMVWLLFWGTRLREPLPRP